MNTFVRFLKLLNESYQRDRYVGHRAQGYDKDDERENAKKADINFEFKLNGWVIEPTIHAASQQYIRRPDMDKEAWKRFHRNVLYGMPKNIENGEYLFFSKSFNQAYIVALSKRKIRVITVLPKGRGNPKPGTKKLIIESVEYVVIEVD